MSKQRPSNRRQKSPDSTATLPRPFDSAAFWRRRVFRNSYTRNGCSMRVKRWSVKIQHQGKRRTFTLATASRSEAAREARSIYQIIRAKGWEAATQTCGRPGLSLTRKPSGGNQAALSKFDACYWQERLIRRKYVDAGLTQANEFSVRMEHEGVDHYFPLGTDDEERAAGKALKIYHTIVARGWEAAFQQFSREITVAIFWSTSPVACTYATLFTFLDEALPGLLPPTDEAQPKKHVFVIEPDAEVRRTLVFWLSRQPGFECTGAFKTAEAAECALDLQRPDLLLVNRALPEMPVVEFLDRLKGRAPRLPAFMYGIYQDSDHIFITLSGVTAGYIFRRRKPTELFEPIRGALRQRVFSAKDVFLQIRHYFQSLFGFALPGEEPPGLASLTAREQEILNYLSKGFLDKEIASALSISIWTVHNHLKHIYEKLNVHTRTEAVLRHLQK